jgi:hypothetical protein
VPLKTQRLRRLALDGGRGFLVPFAQRSAAARTRARLIVCLRLFLRGLPRFVAKLR